MRHACSFGEVWSCSVNWRLRFLIFTYYIKNVVKYSVLHIIAFLSRLQSTHKKNKLGWQPKVKTLNTLTKIILIFLYWNIFNKKTNNKCKFCWINIIWCVIHARAEGRGKILRVNLKTFPGWVGIFIIILPSRKCFRYVPAFFKSKIFIQLLLVLVEMIGEKYFDNFNRYINLLSINSIFSINTVYYRIWLSSTKQIFFRTKRCK